MKYRSKVVWCLCLLLAGMGIVAVVPRVAHAATICTCCKGTGKNLCKVCGGRGCAQCNWKGEVIDLSAINTPEAAARILMDITTCTCCNGTGKNYTAAEKAAMKKAADERAKQAEAEKARQAAAAEAERVRIEIAAQASQASISTFTDSRDGKTYKKIAMGTQTWMAENLNYNATNSKCNNYKEENCVKYGRLYDWKTALTACPAGTHLPTDEEWATLVDYAGGEKKAGTKLKSSTGWKESKRVPAGTDEFGFSALPGGDGNSDGKFYDLGYKGYWWSSTECDALKAWDWKMGGDFENVFRYYSKKTDLGSVRCVVDE